MAAADIVSEVFTVPTATWRASIEMTALVIYTQYLARNCES